MQLNQNLLTRHTMEPQSFPFPTPTLSFKPVNYFDHHMPMDMDLHTPPPSPPTNFVDPRDMAVPEDLDDVSESSSVKSEGISITSTDYKTMEAMQPPKKKRKSWGQQLPKPTTSLPPRKRAKTEAEKAQRKYERVQRNRQAAHASRMRKQDEMDLLQRENEELKQRCEEHLHTIARMKTELAIIKQNPSPLSSMYCPPTPPHLNEPSLTPVSSNLPSLEHDQVATPESIPVHASPYIATQFNDSHSAEMCSPQWTLNLRHTDSEKQKPFTSDLTLPRNICQLVKEPT